jgi:hypothetical protein
MMTPAQEGFEAGIMRRVPTHPYLRQSTMERQFMDGFKRGRERRAWLDARGMKRVEHSAYKNGPGDWHWELLVERAIHAKGWAKSEKVASQACEDAGIERRENLVAKAA